LRVSIIIPVLNKLEFTRQCLDRIWRNTSDQIAYEVIVVDNGSTDGTPEWFSQSPPFPRPLRYHRNPQNLGFAKANNIGARLAQGAQLLFLNNDTLVQPGWLTEMLRVSDSNPSIGVVGIKQLFPYTNIIYHTGVVFAPGGVPQHLYPHLDASLPYVNKEREYQAVTGACLMIGRALFEDCGGFDEAYVNGYEDTDLCLAVAQRGRKTVCCTTAFIYHYGQISEGRTAKDDQNARLFSRKWAGQIAVDRDEYIARDRLEGGSVPRPASSTFWIADDCVYLADDLRQGSAQTWVNAELALALNDRGIPIFVNGAQLSPTLPQAARNRLRQLVPRGRPVGGVHIKWSHYRPNHLNLELAGDINLEFFVINYLFGRPGESPWDYWLQSLKQNHCEKLPVSEFCHSVLLQLGLSERECHVLHHGYSREILDVEPSERHDRTFRFLTVTNSHDLGRYNTLAVIDAYGAAFVAEDDVALVVKDYGASSGDTTIRQRLALRRGAARIDYVGEFTDKRALIRLYKACDAFVSPHRGEGFGMKILDAMACGLPVITPLFGGPTTYCRPDNCFPVTFALTPVGDCLDTRSLNITNSPMWAEVDPKSLREQMRRVYADRAEATRVGAHGRATVIEDFTWDHAAGRLMQIITELRSRRPGVVRARTEAAQAERSPYWLGLRMSVVVPTHNRREKLLACLAALARQSVLPQEFEVIVVDDGSTDGTKEAVEAERFPFLLRYYRQESKGPGAARNLGIELAAGEYVLFIGDDILADERLIEEHLLAHAASSDPGTAILGHIDWPKTMTPNAVMEYVCGAAMLQFAYSYIPHAPSLDHRFFYTSNVSIRRRFLIEAAAAGIRFDSCFTRAAFEDAEFAFRLIPRGLRIQYAAGARVAHDHWMDLDTFAKREFGAGTMAVVFYRKHPSQDEHLQVRWLADLVEPAATLLSDGEVLQQLEALDSQTDNLIRALAESLETVLRVERQAGRSSLTGLPPDRLRAALHSVLKVLFDVQRTRGKVQEWYSGVAESEKVRAALTLAAVMRKIDFVSLNVRHLETLAESGGLDNRSAAALRRNISDNQSASIGQWLRVPRVHAIRRALRRFIAKPSVVSQLITADRFIETRLFSAGGAGLANYRRLRNRIRRVLSP
jgi:GT2 family glycosyltransferase/glycosyltransferase involved in cell wall biosynthesis